MSMYRNDQDAALARVDALEQENAQLASEKDALALAAKRLAAENAKLLRRTEQLANEKQIASEQRVASERALPSPRIVTPARRPAPKPITTTGVVIACIYVAVMIAVLIMGLTAG